MIQAGKTKSRTREILINLLISATAFLYLLVILEIVFHFLFIQSDGMAFTLSGKRWISKYWKPINSYGYRDPDHPNLNGKKLLFVVGDSIAAGHGVEDYRRRFANVLQGRLGAKWEVIVLSQMGWDTADEYGAVVRYPQRPDAILLSYLINDIHGVAQAAGIHFDRLISPPPWFLKPLVDHYYVFNFLFWRIYRVAFFSDREREYFKKLSQAYQDPQIWEAHRDEMKRFVSYAQDKDVDLFVVIWPFLNNMKASQELTSKVADFFRSEGVRVLDLTVRFSGRDPRTLTVSTVDGHPNVEAHRETGELIFKEFFSASRRV